MEKQEIPVQNFSKLKKPNKYCLGNQTKFLIFFLETEKGKFNGWIFCLSPSPPNTYSYVGKENLDSTRKFEQNCLNWCTNYLNTSTTIRKILVPKKLLSSVRKYVKPKPISRQNQKLTQQHNWKESSSSPREASVLVLCPSFRLSVRAKRVE